MQASMAAFLNRGKPPSVQSEAEVVTAASHAARGSAALQPNQQLPQEPSQQRAQSQTQRQAAEQLAGEQQPTYAAQLSAAIAASLAASGLPAEPPLAPGAADKPPSGKAAGRLPARTDSRLDVLNNGQYRAWAAFISQAGQGRQAGSGGSNQSAAATAWQV